MPGLAKQWLSTGSCETGPRSPKGSPRPDNRTTCFQLKAQTPHGIIYELLRLIKMKFISTFVHLYLRSTYQKMLLVSSRLVVDLTTPEPILDMLLVIEPVDEFDCKIGFPGKSYDEVI